MSFTPYNADKQDLVVPFPPAPEKNEHGNYPPRPDNLPPRPVRDTSDHVLEKRFGRLVPIRRPLNDEEQIWRNHDYLQRCTRWKCWASRMPVEWCLLEPAEYAAYDNLNPNTAPPFETTTTTVQETYLGIFLLLLLSVGVLSAKATAPPVAVAYFIIIYTLLLPTFRLHLNLVKDVFSSIWAAVSTPMTTLGVIVCWVAGTLGLAVATLVVVLATIILDPLVSLNGQFRSGDSTFWRAIYSVQLFATETRDSLLSEATSAYEARFTLVAGAVLSAGSIYLMLEEPSTTWLCICVALCLIMILCILAAFMVSEDRDPAADSNYIVAPTAPSPAILESRVATTVSGRSGVTFLDPLATPSSISKSSLSEGPRPRQLVHDFGTQIRGPLGKNFGARRSPSDLFEPSFFTTPPRRIFT